jgi:pimeloyl-ACP methyl ester carboxylesterase
MEKKILKTIEKTKSLSIGALNGIVGNHLESKENGLSIEMGFYVNEQLLILKKDEIIKQYKNPTSNISILIHGLTNDETVWGFKENNKINYGTLLHDDFGITPFYLRYNTGLHISENGKQFSQLITELVENYPIEISEINIIAHSMGGLVTRSACYYGPLQGSNWTNKLNKLVFLGTPHLGAPLEKFGNVLTNLLKTIPSSYTKLAGNIIDLRSDGIKDLRYGYLIDEDWKNHHPDTLLRNNKKSIPLLQHVDYYLLTGTLTQDPKHLISEWFGDALVREKSGKGVSNDEHHIPFDLNNHKEFSGIAHLPLAYSPEIYLQIKNWISEKNSNNKFNKTIENQLNATNKSDHFYTKKEKKEGKTKGAISLALTTINEGLNSISDLQKPKKMVAYRILNQIPVVGIFSKQIEEIHSNIQNLTLQSGKEILKAASKD